MEHGREGGEARALSGHLRTTETTPLYFSTVYRGTRLHALRQAGHDADQADYGWVRRQRESGLKRWMLAAIFALLGPRLRS